MSFFAPEKLGETRSRTPEGFLICLGVPIARTGTQEYLASEIPQAEAGKDGVIYAERHEDVVFADDTIASFEGKPVTYDPRTFGHPSGFVTPDNHSELAVGHVQNVRRGEDGQANLLIADLVITDADAIEAIDSGLREVSCGYDVTYAAVKPGRVRTVKIVGNHVALVKKGRAGPSCAIGDQDTMAKDNTLANRLRKLFMQGDAKAFDEEVEQLGEVNTSSPGSDPQRVVIEVQVPAAAEPVPGEPAATDDDETSDAPVTRAEFDGLVARVAALETASGTAPSGDSDEDEKKDDDDKPAGDDESDKDDDGEPAGDADEDEDDKKDLAGDALTVIRSQAAILGFPLPAKDSRKITVGEGRAIQRDALAGAAKNARTGKIVAPLLGGKDVSALANDAIPAVFAAAAALIGAANNAAVISRRPVAPADVNGHRPLTNAELNELNRKHWGRAA